MTAAATHQTALEMFEASDLGNLLPKKRMREALAEFVGDLRQEDFDLLQEFQAADTGPVNAGPDAARQPMPTQGTSTPSSNRTARDSREIFPRPPFSTLSIIRLTLKTLQRPLISPRRLTTKAKANIPSLLKLHLNLGPEHCAHCHTWQPLVHRYGSPGLPVDPFDL